MANQFNFTDWLTMEGLRRLKNKLVVARYFNTDYNKEYTKEFAVGETIRVPLPQRFTIRNGLGYTPQGINRRNTEVTVNQVFGVDFEWDSVEAALKMERGQERIKKEYLNPAMDQIAQEIDSRCAQWAMQNANNIVGVLGTNPTSFDATSAAARQRLIELACPPSGEKAMLVSPAVMRTIKNAAIQYFNPQADISKQYREGSIGRADGFDWYESMSLYSHTAGIWAGAVTLNAASVTGDSSFSVACTAGDTFKKGDVVEAANVFPVNPSTRRRTNSATEFQWVITQDVTAAGATATLPVYPTIYGPGSQYQNVDALPANGAALTLFPGTAGPNGLSGINGLAIHEDAFALVGVKLEVPKAAELASQTRDPETGISVRFVRMFDPVQSKMINRFDVLIGFGNLYADTCAVRVLGA